MVAFVAIPKIKLGELKKRSFDEQSLLMYYLSLRGNISIKIKGALIQTEVIDSWWEETKGRIVMKTSLRTQEDGQPMVLDIYLLDIVERKWAKENKKVLFRRETDDINHIPAKTTFRGLRC